jgi:hypothetical protein
MTLNDWTGIVGVVLPLQGFIILGRGCFYSSRGAVAQIMGEKYFGSETEDKK